jgi:hypothetical protein
MFWALVILFVALLFSVFGWAGVVIPAILCALFVRD